jgi:hypothetical protein
MDVKTILAICGGEGRAVTSKQRKLERAIQTDEFKLQQLKAQTLAFNYGVKE